MEQYYKMLEFTEIRNRLKENASTQAARERIDKLCPVLKEEELYNKLEETKEARKMLDILGNPPGGSIDKIREIVDLADKGDLLSMDELDKVKLFTILTMRTIRYLENGNELGLKLASFGNGMTNLESLKTEIERCIRGGRIDDYASKELLDTRRKIELTEQKIKTKLDQMLRNRKECFSESFVSNRNGHYTLPVKKEYKSQITGSVIDSSSSGATFFIEPSSVAKIRVTMDEYKIQENNEERRILYMLSAMVGNHKSEIDKNLDYLEELDFIFAKGKLSAQMDGIEAKINTDRRLSIVEGRHPLLDKKLCVPLNIAFGEEKRGIIITGPNTGGKTVTLKTIGLFSLMTQCGLHIPCKEADIAMNSHVLCDIGDGQSITESLSTFSSHMKNIISILCQISEDSLVLLDELGSGTDPLEGMGIAIAVIEELILKKCNFVVTTHYPQVKEYANKEEAIINARMAFDKESLKPLYMLELGEAGESCAFYIAKQLGMSGELLKRAYTAAYEKNPYESNLNKNDIEKKILLSDLDSDLQKTLISSSNHKSENTMIQKKQPVKQVSQRAFIFQKGDSVMVYPHGKLGIVYKPADEKGDVIVQVQKRKISVNHKRLQIKALSKDLYPPDYDFSIIFDSVLVRKARHDMDRKYTPGLEITQKEDFGKYN